MINRIFDFVTQNSVIWVIALGYAYSLHDFATLPF
jgi:hypothetical protein